MEDKSALRRRMRAAREGWEAEYRQEADAAIARHMLASEAWRAAGTVFAYVSVGCEVDTRALIEAALKEGKRVCAPRCLGKGRMEARAVESLEALVPGAHGCWSPPMARPSCRRKRSASPSSPALPPTEVAIASATAAAITTAFCAARRGRPCAFAGARALLEDVPREEHDAAVDMVVSEAGIAVCGKR